MTILRSNRFHQILVIGAISAGALGLAAGSASAATTWGGPEPTPTVSYTPPPQHEPTTVCEFSLLTETDTVADVPGSDQQPYGNDWAGAPSSAPESYGQPNGGYGDHHTDTVHVVQLAKFCVTEGEHGRPDKVRVWDESAPFAWVSEQAGHQMAPTYSGVPSAVAPYVTG